ncbi:SEC-C metal-binding domain-containing protein [Chloroflexota bacterium]
MSSEYIQSNEELQQHLRDTVQALELSTRAFDEGYDGEAKRLAAAIRVLFHDTGYSKSLLGQLGQKTILFYDTCLSQSHTHITYSGLTAIDLTLQGATHVALLDNLPPKYTPRWVSFDEWWNRVIFVDQNRSETSRKDLILSVADKDGGVHVDPILDEKYADLSRRNALGWMFQNARGEVPIESPQKAAVRQIAHEVLKSLNPAMPTLKPEPKGVLSVGPNLVVKEKQPIVPKVGRNNPCPCGSGKKYKRCHGKL